MSSVWSARSPCTLSSCWQEKKLSKPSFQIPQHQTVFNDLCSAHTCQDGRSSRVPKNGDGHLTRQFNTSFCSFQFRGITFIYVPIVCSVTWNSYDTLGHPFSGKCRWISESGHHGEPRYHHCNCGSVVPSSSYYPQVVQH